MIFFFFEMWFSQSEPFSIKENTYSGRNEHGVKPPRGAAVIFFSFSNFPFYRIDFHPLTQKHKMVRGPKKHMKRLAAPKV